jgi:predicted GIY-YIG superfamily endonuclease
MGRAERRSGRGDGVGTNGARSVAEECREGSAPGGDRKGRGAGAFSLTPALTRMNALCAITRRYHAGTMTGAARSRRPASAKRKSAGAKKQKPKRAAGGASATGRAGASGTGKPAKARAPRYRYSVYVIELHPRVWNSAKFRVANPGHDHGKACVYVGSTGLTPEARFAKHKAGIQANRFVQEHGVRLLPALYAVYNPMPYAAALAMEVELADGLREQGFAVWQG